MTKVWAFSLRWHSPATAAERMLEALYGLDADAPYARVGRVGAAFLASLRGHRVIEVDTRVIAMVTRTSALLRIYRREVDPGVALAWEPCG